MAVDPQLRAGGGPRTRRGFGFWALAALAVAEACGLTFLGVRARWLAEAGATPVARGERVAARMGCFGCHGPGGEAGSANPGARTGGVPAWSGGTWMMFNQAEGDVRAWILDGHPPGRPPDPGALIHMPAYRGRLGSSELRDLLSYVLTVQMFGRPADPAAANGRDAALRLGCFGCHGPEGRGLVRDPGSLKGYVPPWDGPDYPDLVRSEEEFRQWVCNGITDRFRANPAARRLVEGEAVRMPAYGSRVKPEELDSLLAFVKWVRAHPRG